MPARTLILGAVYCFSSPAIGADAPVPDVIQFNRDVRPIFSDKCYACHGPDKGQRKADLRLDTKMGIADARKSGAIRSGKPSGSDLVGRIASDDPDEQMPPPKSGKTLSSRQQKILSRWIEQGAQWRGHWAYIKPTRTQPPQFEDAADAVPIDRYLLAKIRAKGLTLAPRADRATLIRRLSLDLIGLSPTPEEVAKFEGESMRDPKSAFLNLTDRLLESPHFGERMAIYWLDLVRYADSVGYHKDSHRNCWLYRDYVIDAFNGNKPFDQFATEQLAGDLLPGDKFEQFQWKTASGFNRMNQTTSEGGAQAKEYLAKYSADRVRNTAAIFLGVTMGCAECHDHKYDPITTRDFYSFAAFFADLQERGVGFPTEMPMPSRAQVQRWRGAEAELHRLREAAGSLGEPAGQNEAGKVAAQIKGLEKEIGQVSNSKSWAKTLITVSGKPRAIRILPRGNWLDDSGPVVEPAIPTFLGSLDAVDGRATRLDLARWVVSRDNPLTARVFVNRLWKLLFGEGIARSLDDLGSQGEWPTHPELLDWLAVEFIESGWDVKNMVKLLVTTDAYQRSSAVDRAARADDLENRHFARQASFRLDAEIVRDNALATSGLLSTKIGGRSVKPYQPANYWYRLYKDGKYNQDHGDDLYRRGLYTYWRRSFWHPSLQAFDAPAREECVAARPRSNTPQQALVLLNDPTYVEAARALGAKMMLEGGGTVDQRNAWVYRRALARNPSEDELAILKAVFERHLKKYDEDADAAAKLLEIGEAELPDNVDVTELAAWTAVARVILNLHETITRN
ncbi:MAG: PSD1 and planctomycete cytochrome C domain-containing protein [Pirellulales bacterium]